MAWAFYIREVSANCYQTEAIHDSGQKITKDGVEGVIEELLADVYRAELKFGTLNSVAAYSVTLDFLGQTNWEGKYFEKMFGSWTIQNRDTETRAIHYDGRDFILMVSKTSGEYAWQGRIEELVKGRCHYFREAVYL